jgi:glycosyltransferase involved in cell wall biosynthesis
MTEVSPSVISIGYGRHMFVEGNPERLRMERCARETSELHMVIFTMRNDKLAPTVGQHNLSLHPTGSHARVLMILDAFLYARYIIKQNKNKTFVVTTQDPFEAGVVGFLLKKLYGVRLVVQEHGDVFAAPFWRRESLLNQLRYTIGKRILASADTIRVVSKRTKEFFESKGYSHVRLLSVAIDARAFKEATPSPLIKELFTPDNFVFLSVARFVPQKNLTMLINAFYQTFLKYPQARLLLVGTGPEEYSLRSLATQLFGPEQHIVEFVPWSDDVPGLMNASDAYVLSSNYEGWGRVLIEAMASGLPIVTTDVGCAGEVVQDERHGLVVPAGNTDAMTKALLRMATDEVFLSQVRNNLATVELCALPGTQLEDYGKEWVKTLQLS